MTDFIIRFFLCNILISGIIGILLLARRIFKNNLSSRMQYHLWFLLLGLLAVPFLPFRPIRLPQMISWLYSLRNVSASSPVTSMGETAGTNPIGNANWMDDFALSVSSETPSVTGYILFVIWVAGMIAMIILVIKSSLRLRTLQKSALPLQNPETRRLYERCLNEMEITIKIPVCSTAFLKSPIIVGFLKPCIYLPLHLISDYNETDMRYMLLHELQHYKHKDAFAGYLMNLAGVIYWFNPFVWYALKEMRDDREVACDTSVLKMLDKETYEDYGNTLINFAEKVSLTPFPFAAGLGGNMKQMKRRILNIATYEKPTFVKKLKGVTAFIVTAVLLFGFTPFISTYAADESHYQWDSSSENISYVNLSAYFGEYEGSFVLYDSEHDSWNIHGREHATLRVSPNSTYKIYDALFGLEDGVITPDDSFIPWNGENYPFEAWNTDHILQSAMNASVNWYFQSVDEQLGADTLYSYIQKIGYGNENISGELSAYWMESSLEISPIEQVELLTKLYNNHFDFSPENINAVKDSIRLFSSDTGKFYGKTGTGRIDGRDVNGWFIGFIETADNAYLAGRQSARSDRSIDYSMPGRVYFFATNIRAVRDASGSNAAEITMSILSDMNIWK